MRVLSKLFKRSAIALAAAMAMCAMFTGTAFATDFTVNCHVSNADGSTTAVSETIDIDQVITSSRSAVYGQYYKNGAWNVLATTKYATFQEVINSALSMYNADHFTSYSYSDLYWSTGTMTLTVADEGGKTYTKYYPTQADMTTRLNFYGTATNSITSFAALTPSYTNCGAVFARMYGSAATASGSTATAAASTAVSSQTESAYPRLITGCSSDMTSSTAMGKRYVYDVTGISL